MQTFPFCPALDRVLLFSVLTLMLLGLVAVTSSSMPVSVWQGQGSFYYFFKQGIFAILALIGLFGILYFPTSMYQQRFKVCLLVAIILLLMVLIPHIGHAVNGSKRWILLGPIALQVSEFVKLFTVIFIAQYLIQYRESVFEKSFGVLIPMAILGVLGLLLLLEPDFGATVVLFITCFGMMFMAGVRARWFILFVVLSAIIVPALVILSPYRMARFTGFLHPWDTAYTTGYQLTQSLIAFGQGGIFGVGLGNSVQKLFYLPEANTDFVLAIFAEELGLLGVLLLLLLYALVVWRGLLIAKTASLFNRLFASYVAYGLTFWIALQVIVNVGVNIGLLPTKGLTLPFMSYGGSSLLVDTLIIGILLRIDLENQIP